MDVFERVVNGTLHREIKYQFARGHFHVGWRSKTSGNAVTIKGLSTIQKKIHEKWSQEQRDYFFKHYFLIFSFETVQKSLQFGFQTQDYWAVVEDLPPQQRKTFEKKLKQKLSECRREIKKWFPKKSENGKHSQPQNPPKAQNQQNQQNRSKPKPKPKPQRPPSPRNANAVSEQKEVELVDEEKVSEQKEMDQVDQRTERRLPNGSNGRNGSRNKVNERIQRKTQQKSSREQRQNGNSHNANKSKRKRTVSASSGSSSLSLSTERNQPIQPTQPTETRPLMRTKPSMNDILLKYHEIEELQCQTAVLYTNIIEMLTCNQSADEAVGEDNLNLFMSAIGTANSMYQKHKEAVSLYFEHAQIAEEQQEALQRGNMQKQQEIDSLNKMMDRQKQEIKALNRSVKRKEEQISKMKKERNRKNQQTQEMKESPQIQQIEESQQDQEIEEVPDIQDTQALAPLAPPAPLGPSQWLKEQDSKESKSPPEVNPYMALNPKANEFQPMGMGTYSSVPMQTQSDHEVYGNDQEEVDEEYDDDLKREELYDDGVYDDEVYDDEVYDDEQVIEDLIIKKNNKMYDYTNGNERNEMKMEAADHHFDDGMFREIRN